MDESKEMPMDTSELVAQIIDSWHDSEYLDGLETDRDRKTLSILLANCKHLSITINSNLQIWPLTTDQLLWLNAEGWKRSRFRKMIAVQPMMGPAGTTFWSKLHKNDFEICSQAVSAKPIKLFELFERVDFEKAKDVYADTLSHKIDDQIFQLIANADYNQLVDLKNNGDCQKLNYDYIIIPHFKEQFKASRAFSEVDVYEHVRMRPKTYDLMVAAGYYVTDVMQMPIFCPYILALNAGRSLVMRAGWVTGKSDLSL